MTRYSVVIVGFVIAFLIFASACNKKQEKIDYKANENVEYEFGIPYQKEITNLIKRMLAYQKMADGPYSEEDVNQVGVILDEYFEQMEKSTSKEKGLLIVQTTVEKFNALNQKCDLELISTSERDIIATILIRVNCEKGYGKCDEDITEEWRDW